MSDSASIVSSVSCRYSGAWILLSRASICSANPRSDMTASARGFAVQMEDLLNNIQAPEYRQLTLETMLALSDIFRANPRLLLDDQLVIDVLIGVAVRLGWEEGDR